MDTIHNTKAETFGTRVRRRWRPKASSRLQSADGQEPRGRPYSRKANWNTVALVGAGIAAGVVLGAGIALLVAPQSGEHTRLAIARGLRRRRPWRHSPWERLGEQLGHIADRGRRRVMARGAPDAL